MLTVYSLLLFVQCLETNMGVDYVMLELRVYCLCGHSRVTLWVSLVFDPSKYILWKYKIQLKSGKLGVSGSQLSHHICAIKWLCCKLLNNIN